MFSRRAAQTPTLPRGDVLATYDTYDDAMRDVDRLAKADFPVKQLSIVGSELHTVERVTGRMTYAKAAIAGAASGAWMGLFFGLLLVLFSGSADSFIFVGAAVLIGAGFGMLFGVVNYSLRRRRRDFTSTHQVIAGKYEIIIAPHLTLRAQQLLNDTTGGTE